MPTRPRISIAFARASALRVLAVRAQPLGDLPADRVDRVERGRRLLEDHRGVAAAHVAAAVPAQRRRRRACCAVLAGQQHGAARASRSRAAGRGSLRAVTVLPLPDSPTIASTSPRRTSRLTSATAWTSPPSVAKVTSGRGCRRRRSSVAAGSRRSSLDLAHARRRGDRRALGGDRVRAAVRSPRRAGGVRSRGSARSLRLSPTSVMPSTTSTIARPGEDRRPPDAAGHVARSTC